eukprot:scaffold4883_cov80-Skeletonema_menzelii.AAC.5
MRSVRHVCDPSSEAEDTYPSCHAQVTHAKNTFARKGLKDMTSLTSTTKPHMDTSPRRALISPHGYNPHSQYEASWSLYKHKSMSHATARKHVVYEGNKTIKLQVYQQQSIVCFLFPL